MVYLNIDMFINVFLEWVDFFEVVKVLVFFKDGKIEDEEVKKVIEKVKDLCFFEMFELFGEVEF